MFNLHRTGRNQTGRFSEQPASGQPSHTDTAGVSFPPNGTASGDVSESRIDDQDFVKITSM
ncbi:hypothetical protein D083_1187 [Dickeya solani RNS 08.23.3.1.A]|nr:hypothetical protein D083_1187 [Dickeya solani RNS 08.23.3.1.A]